MKKILLCGLVFVSACATNRPVGTRVPSASVPTVVDGKLFTSLYQQRAAEYRALCFQAFNTAMLRLQWGDNSSNNLPRAIITDIDETILDNSAYAVKQGLMGKDYETASWYEWTALGAADTVPGAPAFLRFAAAKGLQIFYVTNREEKERTGTLNNLLRYQLPFADNEHLIMKQGGSSKEGRRQEIMKRFDVRLFLGDNLADFSALFDKKTVKERSNATDQLSHLFGDRFIIIPNPVYGDWETSLYQYNYSLTPAQKDSIIKASLKSY